jgi:initiation factor 2B subunit 1/2 family protein
VPADVVVVGTDAVTPATLVNKFKTRALAEQARAKGIPIYAVAGEFKFIGDELPVRLPFEAVPLGLFSAVAGPIGLFDASHARDHAQSRPIHQDLRPLHDELLGQKS